MPSTLENENVHLKNVSFFPADGILGHVSYYHFKIHDLRDDEVDCNGLPLTDLNSCKKEAHETSTALMTNDDKFSFIFKYKSFLLLLIFFLLFFET